MSHLLKSDIPIGLSNSGTASPVAWRRMAGRAGSVLLALIVAATAGEIAARLDDYVFADVPIEANPDRGQDLLQREPWGIRGKSGGSYRRWQLNSHGFSSPEIAVEPPGRRVMVLGASETFGLYESRGKDYPAQLSAELARRGHGDVEVVNAAIAGMAVPSLTVYWERWASRFKPQTVLVYPSSHFYLDIDTPSLPRPVAVDEPLERTDIPSRFAMRLRDHMRQATVVREVRARLAVSQAMRDKPADYVFERVPHDRVRAYARAVERLAEAIERSGSTPVLMTQALKMPRDLSAADRAELERFRVFYPRAVPEVFPPFFDEARKALIELGRRRGWAVIDTARPLSGIRGLFADAVHFNDQGSGVMAGVIADRLVDLLPPRTGGR